MPLYDYVCKCGYSEEILVGSDRPTKQKCPDCGGWAFRQYGSPRVRFLGDGWQTPKPYDPRPWEGSALEGAEEQSQEFVAKRKERGHDPRPREKKITVDHGAKT